MTRAILVSRRFIAVPPETPPTVAIPGNQMIRYTGTQGLASDMGTFSTVVLSPYETVDLATLRGASPTTKALAYLEFGACTTHTGNPTLSNESNAVTLEEAQAWDNAHPTDRWLMYSDATGTALVPVPADHLMNIGSVTYQARIAARLQEVHDLGVHYDGIHFDNINSTYLARTTGGVQGFVTPPTGGALATLSNTGWKTKMLACLAYQRSAVPTYYLLGNCGESSDDDGTATKNWWDSIYPHLDGLQMEFFVMNGGNHLMTYNDLSTFMGHYNARLSVASTAYSHGKDFIAGASGNGSLDLVKVRYQKASFLLVWNGTSGGAFYENIGANVSYINDSFTTWIGIPDPNDHGGVKFAVGTGWRRNYTQGTVIVNPNKVADGNITFDFGGATYLDDNGNPQTSVTLTPVTAMILTKP